MNTSIWILHKTKGFCKQRYGQTDSQERQTDGDRTGQDRGRDRTGQDRQTDTGHDTGQGQGQETGQGQGRTGTRQDTDRVKERQRKRQRQRQTHDWRRRKNGLIFQMFPAALCTVCYGCFSGRKYPVQLLCTNKYPIRFFIGFVLQTISHTDLLRQTYHIRCFTTKQISRTEFI